MAAAMSQPQAWACAPNGVALWTHAVPHPGRNVLGCKVLTQGVVRGAFKRGPWNPTLEDFPVDSSCGDEVHLKLKQPGAAIAIGGTQFVLLPCLGK